MPSLSEPPHATRATPPPTLADAVAQWGEPLTRYATRILGDRERARDVVQDTFLRFYESGREVSSTAVKSWLFSVCRNRALDVLRHERRAVGLDAAGEPSIEPRGERDRVLVELGHLLSDLPEHKREVMALRYRDGHSYRQISERTGLTVSHVGTILHQATQTLKGRVAIGAALVLLALTAALWPTPEPAVAERAIPTILDRTAPDTPPTPIELERNRLVFPEPAPTQSVAPNPKRPSPPQSKYGFDGKEPPSD